MEVLAEIKGIKYIPHLCNELKEYSIDEFKTALSKGAAFLLNLNKNRKFAVSRWVSAKRTRSYPYGQVYNTLPFTGKKITIIPVYKDEGKAGDRDFIQWDTISLMSLLGVHTIIAYYNSAVQSSKYATKITRQQFDIKFVIDQFANLANYQSDALHWNLSQIDKIGEIAEKALESYTKISNDLGIKMHSEKGAIKRIEQLKKSKNEFMNFSRNLAKQAQNRESLTIQPKEFVSGEKCIVTIKNYLGGLYFLTADEIEIKNNNIYLIEAKHTDKGILPNIGDIKDGLVKMILFTNIEKATLNDKLYKIKPVLKLTSSLFTFNYEKLSKRRKAFWDLLLLEAKQNNFEIRTQ